MHDVPWEPIEYFNDINAIVEVWNNMFLEVVKKHAPLKSHCIKRKYQPDWLTRKILDIIKERDKCKVNGQIGEYRILRNKVSMMIDSAKKEAYMSLSWFKSYHDNRTQQVVVNNSSSISGNAMCGVPQGSILGPPLFLLFINDLPLSLQNLPIWVDLYADDTTLYNTALDLDKSSLENNLQKALDSVHTWCLENGMFLNTDKTKLM